MVDSAEGLLGFCQELSAVAQYEGVHVLGGASAAVALVVPGGFFAEVCLQVPAVYTLDLCHG